MARILVVDDSSTLLAATTKILVTAGHEVIPAVNGEEGIAKAASEKPDLVLMDVVMPGMNGFQVTRHITKNEDTKHIPVIMLTTKDQETDKVWGKRQGADEYLTKPVKEAELIKVMESL